MSKIHPTAYVDPQASLGADVSVGPFSVIEADVKIGAGCELASHVVIKSGTSLGRNNQLADGAVLGGRPQHLRAGSEVGRLRIGNDNTIREYATIHRGLEPDSETTVGDGNLIMINAHIAHDCEIGSHAIIANGVMMAGHITIGDRAYISGAVGMHQFCRVGHYAMVGGQAHIKHDVPPFVTVDGQSSKIVGLNLIGLRRNGFDVESIKQLKAAYRVIYREGHRWDDVLRLLSEQFPSGPAADFLPFLSTGQRGFIQERATPRAAALRLVTDTSDTSPADSPPARKAA